MVTPSSQRVGDLLLSAAVVVGAIGFTTAFDTTPEAVKAAVVIALRRQQVT